MKTISLWFAALLIFLIVGSGCETPVAHPAGGFPYPQHISSKDSLFFYLPIKDVVSKKISFGCYYMHNFYRRFNEPNISLSPLPDETIRLTYITAFGGAAIISLNRKTITVKEGSLDSLSYSDKSLLTDLEKTHLYLLNRFYPFDTTSIPAKYKGYIDSMIKAYPPLLDEDYYHKIYEKEIVRTNKKMSYTSVNYQLSGIHFNRIFKEIDAAGFWTMNNYSECNRAIADGFTFILEANTDKRYQCVSVQSCPNNKSGFVVACQNIIKLARLDKKIDLIWIEN